MNPIFFIITVDNIEIINVKLISTIIENMQVNRAQGQLQSTIINRIKELSVPFGTLIEDGTITIK